MAERALPQEPFASLARQHDAGMLGMYVFLASELMLFGGLIVVILIYRLLHPQEIVAASHRLHIWIGAFNTLVLLTSSLAVAAAVEAARCGFGKRSARLLAGASVLGLAFLAAKAIEYRLEYGEGLLPGFAASHFSGPVEQLFMNLYLVATGLHAVHLIVGIALMAGLAWRTGSGALPLPDRANVVQVSGLYWHLVDVIWIFLYPILYLAR
jgi:cytochrome c oxidase subunit 3